MYNGRYFKDILDNLLKIEDSNNKITLLYIDLDRFKTINDTYGHDVGEPILIEISKRLAMTNNDDNILARLGGDEFVILLKGSYIVEEIEMLLRNADYNKEFQLYYQPQINIQTEKLVGVEALIRWNSPVKGNIRPDKFIKIAEEIGCIEKISDWVMKEAARQIYEWNTKYEVNLKMGINISPKKLDGINFIIKFQNIIDTYKLNPQWLDILWNKPMSKR